MTKKEKITKLILEDKTSIIINLQQNLQLKDVSILIINNTKFNSLDQIEKLLINISKKSKNLIIIRPYWRPHWKQEILSGDIAELGLEKISKENHIKDAYDCVHRTVRSYIKNNNWMWLLLINYQSHNLDEADTSLMKLGFTPLLTNKMFTKLIFNENYNLDISSLSKNWRHNLKRAKINELMEIEWMTSYEDRVAAFSRLSEMYEILKKRKKFGTGFDLV